jgi:teichuronic acid biosynthesis glycosyltransferase TuaC
MKILMVIPANISKKGTLLYSGLLRNEVEGLSKRNIKVDQYYLTNRLSLIKIIQFANEVRNGLINSSPDIIHIQTGTAALFKLFLKSNIPWVMTIGGSDLLGYPSEGLGWKLRGIFAGLVTTICASHADKIICVSLNLKQALPRFLHKKIVIVPRGIDINHFKPVPKEIARQKLKWDFARNYVVFSLSQKDAAVKNLSLASSVIDYYSRKFDSNIQLELIVNKTKEEVACMLNAANSLLLTSIQEGSPNIVKEAMACNLPVVAVDCGDIKERLNKVTPSVVTETYDVEEIALALRSIIKENKRSNGRSIIIEQGLDRETTIEKIVAVYKSCTH